MSRLARFNLFFWLLALGASLFPTSVSAQQAEAIRLSAKPVNVLADGVTSTTITAEVRNGDGALVADNTIVNFSTTLGTIESTAPTRGGQASVSLVSSTIAGTAIVTASSGGATADIKVYFTVRAAQIQAGPDVIMIRAKYLLFNDLERVLDATDQVEIRVGAVRIKADRAQIDLEKNVIIAEGKPGAASLSITSAGKTLQVDRARYNWSALSGVLSGTQEPVRGVYNLNGITMEVTKSAEPPPPDTFTIRDLEASMYSVRASRIVLVPGKEIQFQGARILLNGKRKLSLPYHVASLSEAGLGDPQYIGIGPEGPLLDIPYYVVVGPEGSSQFRLKYNAPEGLYGANVAGWALDLVNRYKVANEMDGSASLTRMTSKDWGLYWTHNQRMGDRTKAYVNLDTRSGDGLSRRYTLGNFALYHTGRGYSTTLTGYGARAVVTTGDLRVSLSSAGRPIVKGLTWSVGATAASGRRQIIEQDPDNPDTTRIGTAWTSSQGVNTRLTASSVNLGGGFTMNASAGKGLLWSKGSTYQSTLATVRINRPIPALKKGDASGSFNLVYNFNDYGSRVEQSGSSYTRQRQTMTASLTYAKGARWNWSAFGTYGFQDQSQNYRLNGTVRFAPNWSAHLNAGIFKQRYKIDDPEAGVFDVMNYQQTNVQVRITRELGERALSLVYESYRNHVYLDYSPGRYF